jgi:hypothetical protein
MQGTIRYVASIISLRKILMSKKFRDNSKNGIAMTSTRNERSFKKVALIPRQE